MFVVTHERQVRAVSYLLYHDDIRTEHFEASGEEHDVAPAQDQTQRHDNLLSLHLTGSEHTQQHHQAGVADSAPTAPTEKVRRYYKTPTFTSLSFGFFYSQDNVEGAAQCCLAKVALGPHSQYIRNLLDMQEQVGCDNVMYGVCVQCVKVKYALHIYLQQQDDHRSQDADDLTGQSQIVLVRDITLLNAQKGQYEQ